ncbi:ABC-2 transporter permease [Lentibacillus salicampi]|uniref:ABC-2 transporter permease n=1 Tax=Lentibacillus salicampi TaxID=175306 RepID=A0A4Y9AEV6_9BACI|nr:ABC-2 transporter permease [Lentibacillus salicampi]TFJ94409.1 ABC-2 transporter permease [Lentibacillus salicampi]
MWPLIRRELDGMVTISLKKSFQTYTVFGLVLVLLMWLFGPSAIDYLEKDLISLLIFLIGMLSAGMNMLSVMEDDAASKQLAFLQTLPVRESDIVHAKFLSTLLLGGFIFVWVSVLVSANLVINDVWTIESWMVVFLFLAVLVLLMAGNLLWYFCRGGLHNGWMNYLLLVAGALVLLYLGFYRPSGISQPFLYGMSLGFSVLAYLICWWAATTRVNKKGFPKEVDDPEREKMKEHAEELKRRYAERQSEKNHGK